MRIFFRWREADRNATMAWLQSVIGSRQIRKIQKDAIDIPPAFVEVDPHVPKPQVGLHRFFKWLLKYVIKLCSPTCWPTREKGPRKRVLNVARMLHSVQLLLYINVVRRWMAPTKSWNFWHPFFWFVFWLFEVRFLYHFFHLFALFGNLTLFPFTVPEGWEVPRAKKRSHLSSFFLRNQLRLPSHTPEN